MLRIEIMSLDLKPVDAETSGVAVGRERAVMMLHLPVVQVDQAVQPGIGKNMIPDAVRVFVDSTVLLLVLRARPHRCRVISVTLFEALVIRYWRQFATQASL